jgi:hypothetical protein
MIHHVLLLAVDPAGQDQDQQLPGLQKGLHTLSGCCVQRGSIRDRWAACQPSKTEVASATCGSAEFLYHTRSDRASC